MLILSRKLNESIVIDGRIVVKVLRIEKESVKLGIQAPPEVPVHREEIHDAIQKGKEKPRSNGGEEPPS
jgi:carbon storage regulator